MIFDKIHISRNWMISIHLICVTALGAILTKMNHPNANWAHSNAYAIFGACLLVVVSGAASVFDVDAGMKVNNKNKDPLFYLNYADFCGNMASVLYPEVPITNISGSYVGSTNNVRDEEIKKVQSLYLKGEMPKYFNNLNDEYTMYLLRYLEHGSCQDNNEPLFKLFTKLDLKTFINAGIYKHGKDYLKYIVQDPDFNYNIEDVDGFVKAFTEYTDDASFAAQTGMTADQATQLKEGLASICQTTQEEYYTNMKYIQIARKLICHHALDLVTMKDIISA